MDRGRAVPWNLKIPAMSIAIVVQLLLITSSSYAQSSVPFPDGGVGLRTDLTTGDSVTLPPVSFTSISTVIVTVLSTLTPPPSQEPSPSTNTTAPTTSSSAATLPQTDTANLNFSTEVPLTDFSTDQVQNDSNTPQSLSTDLLTTGPLINEFNATTLISTSIVAKDLTTSISLSSSPSSDGMETIQPTSLSSMGVTDNEAMSMTTAADDLVTYEHVTDGINPTYEDVTTAVSDDEGIFTESFLRLIIIAGATAGSCLILLILVFIIVACCHRRRQRKRNARYYEFKKKDFSSKYEKVEQRNSLARGRDHADGGTPIGGGWVFNSSGYHGEYEDETAQNVALRSVSPRSVSPRSVSPLAVATPLLKVSSVEDQNGVPDSGHGGSITADDSAFGLSPSLEEDIEMELNPLYKAFGASVGTGSEVRDHSYIGGDSDTISEGNEPVNDTPIRDVLFNSFGANRAANEEAVEL